MKRTSPAYSKGKYVLDANGMTEKVRALTDAIYAEFGKGVRDVGIVGIQTRGVSLAHRIAQGLKAKAGAELPVGILDITLYRDDIHAIADQPEVKETDIPFDMDDRPIVLVDDVLFTGRTIRSAMNALIDYGRPECIRLAILVDRGHRELPIGADYVGLTLETQIDDIVDVNFKEVDEEDSVKLRTQTKTTK